MAVAEVLPWSSKYTGLRRENWPCSSTFGSEFKRLYQNQNMKLHKERLNLCVVKCYIVN